MISWIPEAPSLSSKQAHMFMVLNLYTFSFTGFWFIFVFTWCKNSLFHPRIQPKALPHHLCQLRDSVRVLLAFCNSLNSCFVMSELGSGWKVRQASVTYLDGKAICFPAPPLLRAWLQLTLCHSAQMLCGHHETAQSYARGQVCCQRSSAALHLTTFGFKLL